MRILIVDHFYPAVVDSIYGPEPALDERSYGDQRQRVDAELFGETVFEVAALRALGHDASDALVNIRPLQAAWIQEHGGRLQPTLSWGWRLRRGFVPWPLRIDDRWMGEALLEQIRILRPDVVHIQCVDLLGTALIREIRDKVRLVVGQIAAPLNDDRVLAGCHFVVSSLPNFVTRFRGQGLDADWLPLAFEPSLVQMIGPTERNVPASFVGSLSNHHRSRIALLESVAARAPLSVWTGDLDLGAPSPLQDRLQGAAWGMEMYKVLARSTLTINTHIDVAGGYANNLRLYEATGMGALLVTDSGSNLSDLFAIDAEVVSYTSANDCVEKVEHYLEHPQEARAVAAAGQARTLRDHTWRDRMERLIEMLANRL